MLSCDSSCWLLKSQIVEEWPFGYFFPRSTQLRKLMALEDNFTHFKPNQSLDGVKTVHPQETTCEPSRFQTFNGERRNNLETGTDKVDI